MNVFSVITAFKLTQTSSLTILNFFHCNAHCVDFLITFFDYIFFDYILFLGAVILLAAGVYFVREFSKVIAREIERRLGKPSLVRDTSRMHSSGMFSAIWESSKHLFYFIQHLIQLAKIKMKKKKKSRRGGGRRKK